MSIEEIKQKILDSFNGLTFVEKGHKYYLDGEEMIPVSNVTHKFKPVFNERLIAGFVAQKNGTTVAEVIKEWRDNSKRACDFGTEVHDFAERYFYDKTLVPSRPIEEAVVSFFNDMPENIIPILSETKVYSRELKYAGTFDLLCYHIGKTEEESGLIIFDYKTNEDLYKNYKEQTLLYPFNGLLDMPLNVYKLQLSCYQIPLEDIGFKVLGRRLIWLKKDGTYNKIKLEGYSHILREAI